MPQGIAWYVGMSAASRFEPLSCGWCAFVPRVAGAVVMAVVMVMAAAHAVQAQSTASEEAARRAQVLRAGPPDAAKVLFGQTPQAAAMPARAIGSVARGCLAGARALPIDGTTWQVMRLERNRNWGHPELIDLLERIAKRTPAVTGWPGLLVGDISQPRGGPMLTGHASHQIGLDADIWLTPMPRRTLSQVERGEMAAVNVVAADWNDVDPAVWTAAHLNLIRAAALEPKVERIFVNPAIKRAICREAGGDRGWLRKVRPMYGHNYHFHVRIGCPGGSDSCRDQEPPAQGEGCGTDLDWWFTSEARNPKPVKPAPPIKLAQLPPECARVLVAP